FLPFSRAVEGSPQRAKGNIIRLQRISRAFFKDPDDRSEVGPSVGRNAARPGNQRSVFGIFAIGPFVQQMSTRLAVPLGVFELQAYQSIMRPGSLKGFWKGGGLGEVIRCFLPLAERSVGRTA